MPEGVSVIIPAFNEAETIRETIYSAGTVGLIDEILVVDDGSTDGTGDLARAAGARVISMNKNSGKGAALTSGARQVRGRLIALLDADLGDSAGEVYYLILPVLAGEAHMTVAGFPPPRKKGGFGLVKGFAARGIEKHTGLKMNSPLSGQRVMTRDVLERVVPFASGFGVELALTIRVARMGFKVMEVPVQMRHGETGRDIKGFIHRGKQFRDVMKVLATLRREGN